MEPRKGFVRASHPLLYLNVSSISFSSFFFPFFMNLMHGNVLFQIMKAQTDPRILFVRSSRTPPGKQAVTWVTARFFDPSQSVRMLDMLQKAQDALRNSRIARVVAIFES
jgi:hypothetical protein